MYCYGNTLLSLLFFILIWVMTTQEFRQVYRSDNWQNENLLNILWPSVRNVRWDYDLVHLWTLSQDRKIQLYLGTNKKGAKLTLSLHLVIRSILYGLRKTFATSLLSNKGDRKWSQPWVSTATWLVETTLGLRQICNRQLRFYLV